MEKYFWREKNADKFINEFSVLQPTKQELFDEIIKKFYEKLDMINVIFDKTKRNEYLSKKNKTIPKNTAEIVIQQKIGTRVIVDFLQLIKDLSDLKNITLQLKEHNLGLKNEIEIYNFLKIEILKLKMNTAESLQEVLNIILFLVRFLSLKYDILEIERQKVEEKEGSFLKGKFVIK